VGEERLHLGAAHVLRMALGVEQDEARDPIHIGLLGAVGIVLEAQRVANLIEQFLGRLVQVSPRVCTQNMSGCSPPASPRAANREDAVGER
jgi:hypothetical protein